MVPLSGTPLQLEGGDYRADIASVGASLRSLTYRGRDLVLPYPADEVSPRFRGAVLAPWPNRVGSGRWTWRGETRQLALTEPERGHALHGLALWLDWQVRDADTRTVTLTTRVCAQPGYPFTLDLAMTYRLGPAGLAADLVATNAGPHPAPYGCGVHPYLVAGPGPVDGWTTRVPARRRLEVDDALLPVGEPVPPPAEADFTAPHRIGAVALDHAYTAVEFVDGRGEVTVVDDEGDGVAMGFGPATPWVQVHTSDRPDDARLHRRALAVEPMTCPPDALSSGVDLVVLEPGGTHRADWTLRAL